MFGERVSWSCPCHVPTLMIKVSCNHRVFIAFGPRRIPLRMQSTCGKCVYVLACATYVPSISSIHTVVLPRNMQAHQYIYIYIHLTWLQWHSKHLCTLGVPLKHIAVEYATSMLPISQGALETSISTWRLLFIWCIDILNSCSKIIIYYRTWNYFLTKHKHYMISSTHQI